jgi:hypothetical protein
VERFAAYVAVRPSYWPSLLQLARNSKRASQGLSAALQQLLNSITGKNASVDLGQALRGLQHSAPAVH